VKFHVYPRVKVVQSRGSNWKGKLSRWRKEVLKKKDRDRKRREKRRKERPHGGVARKTNKGVAICGMMKAAKPKHQATGKDAVRKCVSTPHLFQFLCTDTIRASLRFFPQARTEAGELRKETWGQTPPLWGETPPSLHFSRAVPRFLQLIAFQASLRVGRYRASGIPITTARVCGLGVTGRQELLSSRLPSFLRQKRGQASDSPS